MRSSGDSTWQGKQAQRRGSINAVVREAGVSLNTVKRGLKEREAGDNYQPGERIRKPGGGRKKLAHTDPMLLVDLEGELEPKGDPMSLVRLVRWTCAGYLPHPCLGSLIVLPWMKPFDARMRQVASTG